MRYDGTREDDVCRHDDGERRWQAAAGPALPQPSRLALRLRLLTGVVIGRSCCPSIRDVFLPCWRTPNRFNTASAQTLFNTTLHLPEEMLRIVFLHLVREAELTNKPYQLKSKNILVTLHHPLNTFSLDIMQLVRSKFVFRTRFQPLYVIPNVYTTQRHILFAQSVVTTIQ
jgi:hypothetical protein